MFVPFYDQIVFCCMDWPRFHPFVRGQTWLFPPVDHCEQCCCECMCTSSCVDMRFHFFGASSRSGIAGSRGNSMFHFLRSCQILQSGRTSHSYSVGTHLCPPRAFPLSPWTTKPLVPPLTSRPQESPGQGSGLPVRGRGLERWTRAISLLFSSLLGSRKGR